MSLTVDSGQTLQRCLALDIGGTKIASAIVKNGEIQQRKQISTPQDDAAQAMHQIGRASCRERVCLYV